MIIFPPPLIVKRAPSLTLTDATAFSASALASYSGGVFNGKSFGAAAPDRRMVVGICARTSVARTITAVTIGGIAATLVPGTNISQASTFSEIWQALVPTGTTGDIAITLSGGAENIGCAIYRLSDYESPTPTGTNAVAGDNAAAGVNMKNSGVAMGICVSLVSGAQNHTWTGLTEEGDIQHDGSQNSNYTFGSTQIGAAETPHAISCDNPNNPAAANIVTSTAAWR